MNSKEVATAFYEALRRSDCATLQSLYADHAVFSDPVFPRLSAAGVRAMWALLLQRIRDMRIDFTIDEAREHTVTARWTAIYTFSTGRHVVSHIHAVMDIENGKIVRHTDTFSLVRWARQALGWKGSLLGRTLFLKKKVRDQAARSLREFINGRH